MKKEKTLGIVGGVIAAIVISVIFVLLFLIDDYTVGRENIILTNETEKINVEQEMLPRNQTVYTVAPRDWQVSGPFEIDRSQYALGENVFLRVGALASNENGQAAFLRTFNDTHYEVYFVIPFDGSKPTFNQYFKPELREGKGVCNKNDLIGNWTVVFQGTNYPNIKFEIIDLIVPGEEDAYNRVIC